MKILLLLLVSPIYCDIFSAILLPPSSSPVIIISNNTVTSQFTPSTSKYTCSMGPIYEYSQTPSQLLTNANYYINVTSDSVSKVKISTMYNNLQPSIYPSSCVLNCSISITNNCPVPSSKHNYFDQVYLEIGDNVVSYLVNCNQDYSPSLFEWGLFIIIIFVTVLITLSSIYSRAWSVGGFGIKLNYVFLGVYAAIFLIFGIIGIFYTNVVEGIADGLCWAAGILCVGLCFGQTIYPIKIKFLLVTLLGPVRYLDVLSLVVGLGVTIAWWLTNRNWILNDVISVCICISFIKIFKFISLRNSLIYSCVVVTIEITISLCIQYVIGLKYNSLILNTFNNPMEIQLPCINPILNQKCSWIPITEVIFPGVFLSYMRRFDDSRNSHIYLIISSLTFFVASLIWMVVTIFNRHFWPLDTFTQPAVLLVVVLFAVKRNQIKTVWYGKFYDVQFIDKEEVMEMKKKLSEKKEEGEQEHLALDESVLRGLRVDSNSEMRQSVMPDSLYIRDAL